MRGEPFFDLIFGRIVGEDVLDPKGNVIVPAGQMLDKHNTNMVIEKGVESLKVRSAITCHTISGVCQQCFGMDLSTRQLVEI